MKKFQIDDFLLSQTEDTKLKYSLPPFLERLPEERQNGLKKLFFNTSFSSFQQKRELLKYIQSFNQTEYQQLFRPYGYELFPEKLTFELVDDESTLFRGDTALGGSSSSPWLPDVETSMTSSDSVI